MKNHPKPSHQKCAPFSFLSPPAHLPDFFAFLMLVAALLLIPVIFPSGLSQQALNQHPNAIVSLLPGQHIWKDQVSSFLFGTNDTQEWTANNVETNLTIQQILKEAHFTLMRTFFFARSLLDGHPTTDAEIEQRLQTIEKSHMICLGVLASIDNPAFVKHVVAYVANRCEIYEFGNEPDNTGLSMQHYLQAWNRLIPQLRQLNPQAKFIGPVVANYKRVLAFLLGVKVSGVFPDAISFHWYPCGEKDSSRKCLAKVETFAQVTSDVKGWVREILGRDLPVGITEWNYDAANPPAWYGEDPAFMTNFTTAALRSMMQAGLDFANQFDAASGAGFGRLDLFDVRTNRPKPQYDAIKSLIDQYWPGGSS